MFYNILNPLNAFPQHSCRTHDYHPNVKGSTQATSTGKENRCKNKGAAKHKLFNKPASETWDLACFQKKSLRHDI